MIAAHNDMTIPYLRKAVEWVEYQAELPEIDREWFQNSYLLEPINHAEALLGCEVSVPFWSVQQIAEHCGTAYCVAGYLGQLLDDRYTNSTMAHGVHVSDFVSKQLGLSTDDACRLFNGDNDAQTIRQVAESIAGQPL